MNNDKKLDLNELQSLGRIDLISKFIAEGVQAGMNSSRKHGFSTEFSDFKPYIKGDDLRMLDWRLYARTDKLFIKRFEAETEMEVMCLLDATQSMGWRWQQSITKLEYATNLIAALSYIHITFHNKVGLVSYDGKNRKLLPPRCRRAQLDEIYASLEQVTPDTSTVLSELVSEMASVKKHRGISILVTDFEEDEKSTIEALEQLAATGDEVIVFHILDIAEEELPFDSATHLQDSETGEIIKVTMKELQREHNEALKNFRDNWRSHCEQRGMMYQPINTGMSYVEIIMETLTQRNL